MENQLRHPDEMTLGGKGPALVVLAHSLSDRQSFAIGTGVARANARLLEI